MTAAVYNAGMAMADLQTQSIWSPFDGVALEGPPQGIVLPRVPCFQTTWREWLALHPDTDVVVWDAWPTHRDARHGHGTVKWLGSPGVGERFITTIESGAIDLRLPENELSLGVQINGAARTYSLRELRKGNNVVNDEYAGESLVVFAAPDSHTMGSFLRRIDEQTLDFSRQGGVFKDRQTGSVWTIEGAAVEGPLKGAQLTPADFYFTEWHSWAAYHGGAEIYTHHGDSQLQIEDADFARLIEALRTTGYTVEPESDYAYTLLPLCARKGLTATVNGRRLSFFIFHDRCDAVDYATYTSRCARAGLAAVKADPEDKDIFLDAGFDTRKDDVDIPWSPLIDDAAFLALVEKEIGAGPESGRPGSEKSYADLLATVQQAGFNVEVQGLMLGYILPPNAVTGIWTHLNGDPFMVMKFKDAATAKEHAEERSHRACAGNVVFRSDPERQYRLPLPAGTVDLPDHLIEWSPLPDDAVFLQAITDAVGA